MDAQHEQRAGFWFGCTAYSLWGLFPLYWPLLEPASAGEILAHRMAWSLATVLLILTVLRRWSWIPELIRQPKRLGLIALAATVITVNWGMYIWGVNSGHIVETSLGYFITPLVSIGFGVLLLHERLRPAQWAAVGIGAVAMLVLTAGYGRLPWIALTLAFCFGTYGLIKKRVDLGGIESLAAETAIQFLPSLGFLIALGARGEGTFGTGSAGHTLLLAGTGLVTAGPLICFGAAAVRIPLSMLGLLQYLAPAFQFLLGLFYFHEAMPAAQWAGFALVWIALTILTWDALRTAGRSRAALRRAAGATAAEVPAETPARAPAPQPGRPRPSARA